MSLIFRGENIHSLEQTGIRLDLVQGFEGGAGLSVRGTDVIIPGSPGRFVMNRKADVRRILLEGWVKGQDPEEWRFWTDLLNGIFNPTFDPGVLRVESPYLGIADGSFYTINARHLNSMPGPVLGGMLFQRWSIELESVDPDWVGSSVSGS